MKHTVEINFFDHTAVKKQIDQQRRQYRMTRESLAKRAQVSVSTIRNIEGIKDHDPHLWIVIELFKGLGFDDAKLILTREHKDETNS